MKVYLQAKRKAELIQNNIVCSFIYKLDSNFAHIIVKHNLEKDKYQILIRNVKANRDNNHKIKLDKLPIKRPYLQMYLMEAIEIKWDEKGKKIEKVKLNDSKVDKAKIYETTKK